MEGLTLHGLSGVQTRNQFCFHPFQILRLLFISINTLSLLECLESGIIRHILGAAPSEYINGSLRSGPLGLDLLYLLIRHRVQKALLFRVPPLLLGQYLLDILDLLILHQVHAESCLLDALLLPLVLVEVSLLFLAELLPLGFLPEHLLHESLIVPLLQIRHALRALARLLDLLHRTRVLQLQKSHAVPQLEHVFLDPTKSALLLDFNI